MVVALPLQMVPEPAVVVTVGSAFTVMDLVFVLTHPRELVPVTV